jgi:hypothetical protein
MTFMRLLQGIAVLLCLFAAQASDAQLTAILELNNPSPYLSDWSSNRNTAILHIINTDPARTVKILAEIEHNGKLVAYTNPDKVPIQTIPQGSKDFFGEAIVPMSAMHFENNIDQSTQRTGRIPDGTICVRVKIVDASTLELLREDYKCATILTYTPPYLILPENEATLCKLGIHNVIEMNSGNPRPMFRWTPVVPVPSQPVHYRLAILEVLPGQNPITAFRSARPVFERELISMTELIWPVEYFYPEVGKRYAWSVRALDDRGLPLVSYQDGWATPFFFTVTDECNEGGVDIDGDLIPDINRLGEPLKPGATIEVRITAPSGMPLDPDEPHEFTGRARSTTGGPFEFNWYLREVGASQYIPLQKPPKTSPLFLAPGATKPTRSYELKLVATKAGQLGWDIFRFTTGESMAGDVNGDGGYLFDPDTKPFDINAGGGAKREGIDPVPISGRSRSYVGGYFFLEFADGPGGWLHRFEPGGSTVDPEWLVDIGLGMSKEFYDWMQSSWNMEHERKNGAITSADFDYRERAKRKFVEALISEIQMPALDASSKEPCHVTIKLKPEQVIDLLPDSLKKLHVVLRNGLQKRWTPSNFRLKIDGLDEPCSKVSKIESIAIKQTVAKNSEGELRDYQKEPTSVETPNLVITFPESSSREFYDWHEDFVIQGNNPKFRQGTLEYLDEDRNPLFTLTFKNLAISKLTHDAPSPGATKHVTVEMRCEHVKLKYHTAVLGRPVTTQLFDR